MRSTVKAAKLRLERFEAALVYSFEVGTAVRRAGVYKVRRTHD